MPANAHTAAGFSSEGDLARALSPAGRMVPVSQQLVAAVVDATWICSVAVGCGSAYHLVVLGAIGDPVKYLATGAVVAALFVPFGITCGAYNTDRRAEFGMLQALAVWIGVFLFLAAVSFAFKMSSELSRGAVLSFAIVGYVGLAARRALWRRLTQSVFAFVPV